MNKRFYTACVFAMLAMTMSHAQQPTTVEPRIVSMEEIEGKTTEKTVPTSFTYQKGYDALAATMEYDSMGRVVLIKQDADNYERISYKDVTPGKWTEKTITKVANGTEKSKYQTIRALDNLGRITAENESQYDYTTQQWQLVHSLAYDYEHTPLSDEQPLKEGGAYLIKDIDYLTDENYNVNYLAGYEYVWIEPAQSYVKSEWTQEKYTEYKAEGNAYTMIQAYLDYRTGEAYPYKFEKTEYQPQQPDENYLTIINYRSTDGSNWTPYAKEEQPYDWGDIYKPGDTHVRMKLKYLYDATTHQYTISKKETYEPLTHSAFSLVKHSTWEAADKYYSEKYYCSYLQIGEDGKLVPSKPSYLFANDDYVTCISKGTYGSILEYTIYSAKGEEKRTIRKRDTILGKKLHIYIVEEYKDSKWHAISNADLTLGDIGPHYILKTNEQGYVTEEKNLIDDYVVDGSRYEYNNNGSSYQCYYYSRYSDAYYLHHEASTQTLTDGSEEYTFAWYRGNQEIIQKSKEIDTPEGICYHYQWDSKANDWPAQPTTTSVEDVVTTLADGSTIRIQRYLADGEIKENGKTEKGTSPDGKTSWTINYIKDQDEWIPYTKSITGASNIQKLDFIVPTNPLPEVISQQLFSGIHVAAVSEDFNTTNYYWNRYEQQWYYSDNNQYTYDMEQLEDGTTTYTIRDNSYDYIYVVDNQNRLIAYQQGFADNYEMSYDEDGRLSTLHIIRSDHNDVDAYYLLTYGKIQVTDGINHPTANQIFRLQVNGRTITLSDANSHIQVSKSLQLYSLDGKLVGKSQAGSITVPAADIYIVVADGVKTKVSVK